MTRRAEKTVAIAVVGSAVLALVVSAPSDAGAVTLTNRDDKTHTIEVQVKSSRRNHELAPGKSLSDFCIDGCIVRLNDTEDSDWSLEGSERVSIERGLIYYDGEETPAPASEPDDK